VNAHGRLLGVLSDIARWLESVLGEARTFSDSGLVRTSLVALYVDIVSFWDKAIRAYTKKRSRRVLTLFRPTWFSYDNDYQALQRSMESNLSTFRAAVQAQHHENSQVIGQELLTSTQGKTAMHRLL